MLHSEVRSNQRRCVIDALDPGVRIDLLDGNLRPIELPSNLGKVSIDLAPGVYVARFHKAGKFVEELAMVPPGDGIVSIALPSSKLAQLTFPSAVPVEGTSTSHEWQRGPAETLSRARPLQISKAQPGSSSLFIFMRDPREGIGRAPQVPVSLHALNGRLLFDLSGGSSSDPEQWCSAHIALAPRGYILRRTTAAGIQVNQTIFLCEGWQTQVFLMTRTEPESSPEICQVSILMARVNHGFDSQLSDLRWTESSLRALATKSNVPGEIEHSMLFGKFENPMLGIYASLLHLRRPEIDSSLMRTAFENLLGLVGPIPDVLAIGCGLSRRLGTGITSDYLIGDLGSERVLASPPLLRESWMHITAAFNQIENDAISLIRDGSLADRARENFVNDGPWLNWTQRYRVPLDIFGASAEHSLPDISNVVPALGTFYKIRPSVAFAPLPPRVRPTRSKPQRAPVRAVEAPFPKALELSDLSGLLEPSFEIASVLRTRPFTDLERSVAYWLRPSLDPQIARLLSANKTIDNIITGKSAGRLRSGVNTLAASLGLSSRTTKRVIASLAQKLSVYKSKG